MLVARQYECRHKFEASQEKGTCSYTNFCGVQVQSTSLMKFVAQKFALYVFEGL